MATSSTFTGYSGHRVTKATALTRRHVHGKATRGSVTNITDTLFVNGILEQHHCLHGTFYQGLVFLRSLANLDDWDGDLKNVTDAEAALQKDSDQYNGQHAKSSLTRLVEDADKMEILLGGIRQDIRDFIARQKDKYDDECLRELCVVDPQDDMDTIEMKKDKLLDDAYKWILD
jgi:hypothetical protein